MKKLIIITTLVLSTLVLQGCSTKQKLYILNWQEYIDEELVEKFEDEFDVKVVETNLVSNELMYAELAMNTSQFDVVFPSDYMIEKLANEDYIIDLDLEKIPNLSNLEYTEGLEYYIDNSGYSEYFVPYFWGSLGIMYRTDIDGLYDSISELEWNFLFDENSLSKYKVGMYDASRDSFAAAQLARGKSINSYSDDDLNECASMLKNSNYKMWGDDNLKGSINSKAIDAALVYSGDFFDQLWANDLENINFDLYVPQTNNVFFDGMAIPKNSKNQDLAYEFINFMVAEENAIQNASYVGYCPVFQNVFDAIIADEEMDIITNYTSWYPSLNAIPNGTVYKDLGNTYEKMENKFNDLRVG